MMAGKVRIALTAIICAFLVTGCADIRSKFIRKKDTPQLKRYVPVREYDVRPSMDLYARRYIFWRNWHKEVMDILNDPRETNQKKIVVAIEQEISNLMSMRNMLIDERSDQLQELIDQVADIEQTIKNDNVTRGNVVRIRRRMGQLGKEIEDNFSYRKVAGEIRDEFRRD